MNEGPFFKDKRHLIEEELIEFSSQMFLLSNQRRLRGS